jgi:hypothetical protein
VEGVIELTLALRWSFSVDALQAVFAEVRAAAAASWPEVLIIVTRTAIRYMIVRELDTILSKVYSPAYYPDASYFCFVKLEGSCIIMRT